MLISGRGYRARRRFPSHVEPEGDAYKGRERIPHGHDSPKMEWGLFLDRAGGSLGARVLLGPESVTDHSITPYRPTLRKHDLAPWLLVSRRGYSGGLLAVICQG